MQRPTSSLLGPRYLERGAALATIQGFLQVNRILKASPGSGRNPQQVDSAKVRKTNAKCDYTIIQSMKAKAIYHYC